MLKMLTGLVAKVLRLDKGGTALAEFSDAAMLDWLDSQSKWSGLVAFRWSATGRGWRLMEVPKDYPDDIVFDIQRGTVTPSSSRVRKAIADAMLMASPTDTQAIDWLDEQTGSYTGMVVWRLSTRGRGWRLHETSRDGAKATVRETISDAMWRDARAARRRQEAAESACESAMKRLDTMPGPSHMYHITQTGPETFECGVMAQDGFEWWERASLGDAVESVIQGADTINHVSIARDNITIRLKDPVNAALCRKCGDLIISRHRHNFVECECGRIAVDGGHDYNRRVGNLCDVGEVLTKALFDRLAALPQGRRGKAWVRHG